MQNGEAPATRDRFLRGAFHDDTAAVDEHHAIKALGRREAVGNRDHRSLAPPLPKRREERSFGCAVERTGRLVENKQLWVAVERASDSNALPLTARQPHASLADLGLVG